MRAIDRYKKKGMHAYQYGPRSVPILLGYCGCDWRELFEWNTSQALRVRARGITYVPCRLTRKRAPSSEPMKHVLTPAPWSGNTMHVGAKVVDTAVPLFLRVMASYVTRARTTVQGYEHVCGGTSRLDRIHVREARAGCPWSTSTNDHRWRLRRRCARSRYRRSKANRRDAHGLKARSDSTIAHTRRDAT